jgi:DNA topoisomerase I
MGKLVVVESPAKARTIEKYLSKDYVVLASMGHVRDLPDNASQLPKKFRDRAWAHLGVNVEEGFEAYYLVKDSRQKKALDGLKKALKTSDELILATDEDREGEAISWHLVEALNPKVPIKRMVFHEITKSAIQRALADTREVDRNLVEAQETRRILDRLVGYPLSLLVAKKIKYGLSAGRVQSPAVFLIVQREKERRRFTVADYWSVDARHELDGVKFDSLMTHLDGVRVATSKDFDPLTGSVLPSKNVCVLDAGAAQGWTERLNGRDFRVAELVEKPYQSAPKPPFTTSTLQQEASRKLNFSARDTMSCAQKLYENGLITYMRTDSTHLSEQAIAGARGTIDRLYGESFLPASPRTYATKSKGAQEAHEAIRPTGDEFKHPSDAGLTGREANLYELVWKRTVASQMVNARKTSARVDLVCEVDGQAALFRARGNRIDFPGFMRVYVEGSDDPQGRLEDQEVILPNLIQDQVIVPTGLDSVAHSTKPPSRFTEATLVKKLEEEGIGRPSTYATILTKISDGRYGRKQGKTLVPTFLAFAVADFLDDYFPDLVDLGFTAKMEERLDSIARGETTKVDYLHEFYRASGGFEEQVAAKDASISPESARVISLPDLDATLRVGRYGPYAELEIDGDAAKVSVPEDIAPAELNRADLERLLKEKNAEPDSLGVDPETGQDVLLMKGRFGHYLQLGKKGEENKKPPTASIPKGVEPHSLELEEALQYLALPRLVGKHPEDGKPVETGIGKYGPFVRHNKEYRQLDSVDKVFSIVLDTAVEVLSQPKGGRKKAKVLAELGAHPKTGVALQLLDGRYGPYVKCGKINASIPRGSDPGTVDLKQAVALIDAKS